MNEPFDTAVTQVPPASPGRRQMPVRVVASLLSLSVVCGVAFAQTSGGIQGEWMGMVDAGAVRLRLLLTVERAQEGGVTATFNSVDQGASLTVETISFENGTLRFAIPAIGGSYQGSMQADGRRISGTWRQAGQSFPLTFDRLDEPFTLHRPQNPVPPFPYETHDVRVRNEDASISLACSFVVPKGKGPFAAVLFLSGSGAQDRDETLMAHRPFLVMADHLARESIASLRCDDRGVGESGGNVFLSSLDDLAGDAEAAVRFLAAQPEVNDDRVGLIGHSEGALLAPLVASRNDTVDFLVLLAPPGVPMHELMLRQSRDLMEARGLDPSLIERALASEAEELALVQDQSLSRDELVAKLEARAAKLDTMFSPRELAALKLTEQGMERAIQQIATPWFRSLLRQEPASFLTRLDLPVLALFGSKDLQVAADENAPAVERALEKAPTTDYRVRVLPGLNHLFQHANTGTMDEYGALEETFAPEALASIGEWITSRGSDR